MNHLSPVVLVFKVYATIMSVLFLIPTLFINKTAKGRNLLLEKKYFLGAIWLQLVHTCLNQHPFLCFQTIGLDSLTIRFHLHVNVYSQFFLSFNWIVFINHQQSLKKCVYECYYRKNVAKLCVMKLGTCTLVIMANILLLLPSHEGILKWQKFSSFKKHLFKLDTLLKCQYLS